MVNLIRYYNYLARRYAVEAIADAQQDAILGFFTLQPSCVARAIAEATMAAIWIGIEALTRVEDDPDWQTIHGDGGSIAITCVQTCVPGVSQQEKEPGCDQVPS